MCWKRDLSTPVTKLSVLSGSKIKDTVTPPKNHFKDVIQKGKSKRLESQKMGRQPLSFSDTTEEGSESQEEWKKKDWGINHSPYTWPTFQNP